MKKKFKSRNFDHKMDFSSLRLMKPPAGLEKACLTATYRFQNFFQIITYGLTKLEIQSTQPNLKFCRSNFWFKVYFSKKWIFCIAYHAKPPFPCKFACFFKQKMLEKSKKNIFFDFVQKSSRCIQDVINRSRNLFRIPKHV